ncbi:hypothetical protein L596_011043 [Steinernema carpocapsae]|uniref:Uncharacterized protein n=1 Tax=Steinernema carpocapsae TaxID=34508 RepID=A0A4U5NT49_STECR|nr:hypothetical protein L596_011043 [Steinernema carpocapsae]
MPKCHGKGSRKFPQNRSHDAKKPPNSGTGTSTAPARSHQHSKQDDRKHPQTRSWSKGARPSAFKTTKRSKRTDILPKGDRLAANYATITLRTNFGVTAFKHKVNTSFKEMAADRRPEGGRIENRSEFGDRVLKKRKQIPTARAGCSSSPTDHGLLKNRQRG